MKVGVVVGMTALWGTFCGGLSFVACSFVACSFVAWPFVVCLYGVKLCVSKGDVLISGIIVGWMG